MSASEFIKSHWGLLLVLLCADASVLLIACVCKLNTSALIMMACLLAVGLILVLIIEYMRNRALFRQMKTLTDELEHPYQMHALMARPFSPDQCHVYDALQTMGIASANEVNQLKDQMRQQREYTEAWVHEVKTPLAAALLVCDNVDEPHKTQLKREIVSATKQVDQVLWYARLNNANTDYLIRKISLEEVVRTACKDNAQFLIEHGTTPRITIDKEQYVFSDKKLIGFIVTQAIVNSAKYGARTLAFSTRFTTGQAGEKLIELLIEDDGWGIPSEDLPRVFERGYTGINGRKAASSTGMGLYLASEFCKQIGLTLRIASEEGSGTCVIVGFPFDDRLQNMTQM